MKNKILLIISVLLFMFYMKSFLNKETLLYNDELIVRVKQKTGNVEHIPLNDYLVGVVAGEMPALFNEEALKAQAVASRSYALYKMNLNNGEYDLLSTTDNQVFLTIDEMKLKWGNYFETYYNKIRNAVIDTNDLVMKYDGKIICAYYFSMSNGITENSKSVFGQDIGYLVSVDSSWDKTVKNYEYYKELDRALFCSKLNIECTVIKINDIKRNSTNHVELITINNKTFKGTDFRKILNLRSTDFSIEIKDNIFITTKGYGHDVGMSQNGANEMGKKGYTYDQILNHYYNNIIIEKF